jgi:ABC-type nickel/cobalt efflux system permease component RcnA
MHDGRVQARARSHKDTHSHTHTHTHTRTHTHAYTHSHSHTLTHHTYTPKHATSLPLVHQELSSFSFVYAGELIPCYAVVSKFQNGQPSVVRACLLLLGTFCPLFVVAVGVLTASWYAVPFVGGGS